MGEPLSDLSEVLFRQIHPNSYSEGRPASDRFKPQPRDNGKMSVDRGALTTAAESHALFISSGNRSAAVFGVSVKEFGDEFLKCFADPLSAADERPGNPAHAVTDYSPIEEKRWKNISKRLAAKAEARGILHPLI
jgi:hypothetical protein